MSERQRQANVPRSTLYEAKYAAPRIKSGCVYYRKSFTTSLISQQPGNCKFDIYKELLEMGMKYPIRYLTAEYRFSDLE